MRASPLPMAAFGLVVLAQQSRASMVEQLHYLSKRGATPWGIYAFNTIKTCSDWYDNFYGRSCEDVRDWMFGISPEDFSRWNPLVTKDCGNWEEFVSYCVRVESEEKPRSTSSSSTVKPTPTSIETVATPKPTLLRWDALGCYVDKNTLSTRSSKAGGSGLSVTNCKKACFDDDFRYAGVKAGTECWCGTYVPAVCTEDQTDCNTPCAGNGSQICGGPSVFNIFKAQYALPPPSTMRTKANPGPTTAVTSTDKPTSTSRPSSNPSATPTWQALGCYGEEVGRILPHLMPIPGGADNHTTRAGCLQTCDAAGYTYAGLENGHECWCDNAVRQNGQLASDGAAGCNLPCTGKKDETCGGLSRLDVFFKATGLRLDSSEENADSNYKGQGNRGTVLEPRVWVALASGGVITVLELLV